MKRKKERPVWKLPHVGDHDEESAHVLLLPKLRQREAKGRYKNFTRLTPELFDKVLSMIEDEIYTRDTNWRKAVSAKEKLEITLRFLATGAWVGLVWEAVSSDPNLLICMQCNPRQVEQKGPGNKGLF